MALPGIVTIRFVDTSISILCVDGCTSKLIGGHRVVLNVFSSAMDVSGKNGLNVFAGGLHVEVIDLASTSEGCHELTIWCPPVSMFLSNVTQSGQMKLSSTELKLSIEIQVLGTPVMTAFSEISILLPPEMASSSFDASGCSFSISFNMPTDQAGNTDVFHTS